MQTAEQPKGQCQYIHKQKDNQINTSTRGENLRNVHHLDNNDLIGSTLIAIMW
jgi:hypothetical protein